MSIRLSKNLHHRDLLKTLSAHLFFFFFTCSDFCQQQPTGTLGFQTGLPQGPAAIPASHLLSVQQWRTSGMRGRRHSEKLSPAGLFGRNIGLPCSKEIPSHSDPVPVFNSGWKGNVRGASCSAPPVQKSGRRDATTRANKKPWRPCSPRFRMSLKRRTKVGGNICTKSCVWLNEM